MKVGDLIKAFQDSRGAGRMGVVVKLFEKKIWRTDKLGIRVEWDKIDPEPVVSVLIDNKILTIPLINLEVVREV